MRLTKITISGVVGLALCANLVPNRTAHATPLTSPPSATFQDEQRAKIVRIVTNPVLWRKDFGTLLLLLQSWNISGEAKVSVFSTEAFGARKFNLVSSDVLTETSELHSLMINEPALRAAATQAMTSTWDTQTKNVTVVGQPGRDDGTMRVSATSKTVAPVEFLSPALTISTVKQQVGEPEKVTTQILDNGGDERRPTILTLYHYGGDAIIFAVSDMSPVPEVIDRAILDTAKVSDAIFTNRRR